MASSSMLYDLTLCAACGKKGAHSRCMRCLQTAYCDTKCQKVHWRAGHKRECTKATDAAASTPATVTSAGIADTAANQSTGDDPALTVSTAATATATRATDVAVARQPDQPDISSHATANECNAHATDDDQEDNEHECPICLDRPDTFNSREPDGNFGQCYQCGQLFCGPCNKQLAAAGGGECPACRASFRVSGEEQFGQLHALVHTRSPGRHTPVAQYNLGTLYENGTGVAQDYHEAVRLYALAAAQGYASAQFNLGVMYANGTGVAQDSQEAVRLYALAAAQGHATAQSNLGNMYNNGTGVAQDYHEAVRLYALAAAQGDAIAQCSLGIMYDNGTGVAQDSHEAVRLYALAAAQGFANAQYNLGVMHANGQGGLVQDLAEAATWCRLAAAQGHANALSALDVIATLPINQPGMRVQVFGLTSANGLAINGREGLVQDQTTKPGRAAVLLHGDTKPTSISTTNLRKAGGL